MSMREQYAPGPAYGAEVQKDGDKWTLVLVRELRHPPARVWEAITDPEHLHEWAPFDADRNLGTVGSARLTTVGAPKPMVSETQIKRADKPKLLEFNWGGFDRNYIAMGAAGWHICIDVLDHLLANQPIGRLVGPDAMKFGGWQRLHGEYAKQFTETR